MNVHKSVKNSFNVGFVYVPEFAQFGDGVYYGIPLSYNWLFGQKSHHLELGAGITTLLVNLGSDFNSQLFAYLSPKNWVQIPK